jgi:hypothetical protein
MSVINSVTILRDYIRDFDWRYDTLTTLTHDLIIAPSLTTAFTSRFLVKDFNTVRSRPYPMAHISQLN